MLKNLLNTMSMWLQFYVCGVTERSIYKLYDDDI